MWLFVLNKIERQKMLQIEWRKNHPEQLQIYNRRRAEKVRERYHTDPEYRAIRIERDRKYYTQRYSRLRKEVIQKLGGKCVYCGCDVYEALEVNHINGGGSKELKTGSNRKGHITFYKEILNEQRKDVELVCRVCNSIHWLKLKGITGHTVSWNSEN